MTLFFSSDLILKLAAASLLGGALGLEREIHGRPAGLRTHFLVSLGAAAFMVLSPLVSAMGNDLLGDPGRIAAQIVTGIGFLGAGAIVKEGVSIHGLTTAACLWVAAAIGMACGAGQFSEALLIAALAIVALVVLPYAEVIFKTHSYRVLEIILPLDSDVSSVLNAVKSTKSRILRCDLERDYETGILVVSLLIRLYHRGVTDKRAHGIIQSIEELSLGQKQINWRPR
ncbi:MAG TPA: MgtC/SapB family protein [Chloroflexi bacterium]|nr:MAG: MgtC/SapB family protein [Chloroflexota bacterium]HDD54870.1 MgtC/SapB family protein [Chloroflexota bacterium]